MWLVLVTLSLSLVCATAVAQDGEGNAQTYVEPTDRQVELNEQAVRALADGDAVKAVSLLEESNYLGELNVTYLNLGRSYQQLGKCKKAREAFSMVFEAPEVETPPPGFVESKAQSYLDELEQSCGSEETAQVGEIEDGSDSVEDDPQGAVIPGEQVEAPEQATEQRTGSNTTALIVIGSGVALIGGGVALHFVAEGVREPLRNPETNIDGNVTMTQREAMETESRANTLDVAALSVGTAGLVAAGIGTYLLVTGGEGEPQPNTSVHIAPTPHGWAFGLRQSF
jgi:hypothetical protein